MEERVREEDIEMRTGALTDDFWRDRTFEFIVAENRYVLRGGLPGIFCKIFSIMSPKSKSNRRSASSSTKYLSCLRLKPLVFSK